MNEIKINDLRPLLRNGGKIVYNAREVAELMESDNQPDFQWLFDTATETGNSDATVSNIGTRTDDGYDHGEDIYRFTFTQAGCCTLGIVMEISYTCTESHIPEGLMEKIENGTDIYPEDLIKERGGFISETNVEKVEVYYDGFHDEDGEDDDEEIDGEESEG